MNPQQDPGRVRHYATTVLLQGLSPRRYPQRPDRCYLAYIKMFVLDISDKANPKKIQMSNSPPYTGFMHTMVPLSIAA